MAARRSGGPPRHPDPIRVNAPFTPRTRAILLLGFVAAFISGAAFALAVKHVGGWDNGTRWDVALLNHAHRPLPRWLDVILLVVPWFGTNITIFAVFLPLWAWLWRRDRRDLVFELGVVSVGSYLLNLGLKFPFARPRPSLWLRRGEYSFASYPSGHAIAMMSVLFIVAWFMYRERGTRWQFALWALLVVLMIYSRVYLGVHWPSDVAAGLLVGSIWGAVTWLGLRGRQTVERYPFSGW